MTSLIPEDLYELDDMVHFIALISDWSFAVGDTSDMTEAEIATAVHMAQEQALISGFEGLRVKKMEMLKLKKLEYDKLSQERTRMDSKILHVNESIRKKQSEYSKHLDEYVKHNLDIAFDESKIELKTNDITSKTSTVENILDFRSDNINCKRDEMQAMVDEYRDCREEFQQYQQELSDKTDMIRKEVLVTTTLCKRAQAAIVSEIRKTATSASQNSHNKFLQVNAAENGERTANSRDDLKKYCVGKIMEMRRNDRMALEKEEESIRKRQAELSNPDGKKEKNDEDDEKEKEDDDDSDDEDYDLDAPRREAEKRAQLLLENPNALNANNADKDNISKKRKDGKDLKSNKLSKGPKKPTKFANKEKKPPILTTANYLSNFIDEQSPQHDNLLDFMNDCGEAENVYSRLVAIKKGLESHVVQQACVLTNALNYFESSAFERLPTTKQFERERALKIYENNIQFGIVEEELNEFMLNQGKSRGKSRRPGSSSPERGGGGAGSTRNGAGVGTMSAPAGSPPSKGSRNDSVADGSMLDNSSSVIDPNKNKATIADLLFMDQNDTRNSIGYDHEEMENMDVINLQELFKEQEQLQYDSKLLANTILGKLASKKLPDLQQYEEWLAANDKGQFSFFGDDANLVTPRTYFTTETERRLFDVPYEEDSNWQQRMKASTKMKDANEKSIKSALRKGNGLRSFIKVLFESAGVNFDRNAQVNYNSKGKKGPESNDITELNIEAGLVKLASIMDTTGYQLRSFLENAKKKRGKDDNKAEERDPSEMMANNELEAELVHDPKINTRKLSVTNLSYI